MIRVNNTNCRPLLILNSLEEEEDKIHRIKYTAKRGRSPFLRERVSVLIFRAHSLGCVAAIFCSSIGTMLTSKRPHGTQRHTHVRLQKVELALST